MIEQARRGFYTESIRADITPQRLQRHFTRAVDGYQIDRHIRDQCVFAPHDLIKDPPYSRLDLITCRNVLIYMGSVLQRIVPMFHYALKPGGYLLLGASESVGGFTHLFEPTDRKHKIYSKKPASILAHQPMEPSTMSEANTTTDAALDARLKTQGR